MKFKVVIVILALACIGLGIALYSVKQGADVQHSNDTSRTIDYSNQLVEANEHLKELGQVTLTLSNDLSSSAQQINADSAGMAQLSNSLAAANSALTEARDSLSGARQEAATLNTRIADLEAQNEVLDDQANNLSNRLVQLSAQIEETRNKLAVSETNSGFLQRELQKQLAQRAELEHKFYDLDELRLQVRKIKTEMFVARRAQLMKTDTGGKKGGELLMMHNTRPSNASANRSRSSNYDLNVEIGSDGKVRIIPPLGSTNAPATNSPAH